MQIQVKERIQRMLQAVLPIHNLELLSLKEKVTKNK
jgi:hypothetical protein